MKTKIDNDGNEILDLENYRYAVSDGCIFCEFPIKTTDNYSCRCGDGDEFFPFFAAGDTYFFHKECFEKNCLAIDNPSELSQKEKNDIYESELKRRQIILKEGSRENESVQEFINRLNGLTK